MGKYPPMKLNQEFRFGEWKGRTVSDVIEIKPSYIRYMVSENIIELSNEAFEAFNDTYPDDPLD